jgi:broad specificity phosphatase PhoE/ribonuclease HI
MSRARRLKVIVEADGGARGNPGPAGYGAVVSEAATGEILVERSRAIGVATNNVAEYQGLIAGLQAAADLGAVEVEVRMDSKLVVEQMSGRWQIKHAGLRPLAASAAALAGRFESVRFTWIPRERNQRADALANAAMDGKPPPDLDLSAATSASSGSAAPRSWAPRDAGTATRLVLVRHGETALTAQRRYSGRGDVELSPAGLAQAQATGRRLASMGSIAAAVVCSPLVRCTRTAAEIATQVGAVPVQVEPDLIECDFGDWEGLTFSEVRRRWPEEFEHWLSSPSVAPPGGESFDTVRARVLGAQSRLLSAYPVGTVIVVSHVTPIKLILQDALAANDAFLQRLFLDPAGMSIMDCWRDGGIAVRTVNDTAHLS